MYLYFSPCLLPLPSFRAQVLKDMSTMILCFIFLLIFGKDHPFRGVFFTLCTSLPFFLFFYSPHPESCFPPDCACLLYFFSPCANVPCPHVLPFRLFSKSPPAFPRPRPSFFSPRLPSIFSRISMDPNLFVFCFFNLYQHSRPLNKLFLLVSVFWDVAAE